MYLYKLLGKAEVRKIRFKFYATWNMRNVYNEIPWKWIPLLLISNLAFYSSFCTGSKLHIYIFFSFSNAFMLTFDIESLSFDMEFCYFCRLSFSGFAFIKVYICWRTIFYFFFSFLLVLWIQALLGGNK